MGPVQLPNASKLQLRASIDRGGELRADRFLHAAGSVQEPTRSFSRVASGKADGLIRPGSSNSYDSLHQS